MNYIDPLTQESFIPERTNQRFASRKNQIKYNNLKAKGKRLAKAEVDIILDKNRTILRAILNGNKEIIKSRDFLLGAGFHFGCNTHSKIIKNKEYRCIYEYAYTPLNNQDYDIIKYA